LRGLPGAEAGIQDAPLPQSGLGARLLHLLRDRCRDGVEMAGVKEGRAVPQLHCAVAGNSRTTSPIAQEIDLASAGEIEAMAIAADERACRSG
jgi:hypothetical protein